MAFKRFIYTTSYCLQRIERAKMLMNMHRDEAERGRMSSATRFEARAKETSSNAQQIRKLLMQGSSG